MASRVYLNRPELNAQRFIANHFPKTSGERLYRTGDLAHYLPDGRVVISGRMDNQIKIRGFRVELGEIETALMRHPSVGQAVVIVREDEPGDQRLVAYLILSGSERIDTAKLRVFLSDYLPSYMLPSICVWLDSFPMTPNKKIDRRALPVPELSNDAHNESIYEPQTETERLIAGIFKEVLQIDRVGRFDNFFDLGGHSLLAVQVVNSFEKATGVRMHPGELSQQTVGQLAAWHEKNIAFSQQDQYKGLRAMFSGIFKSLR